MAGWHYTIGSYCRNLLRINGDVRLLERDEFSAIQTKTGPIPMEGFRRHSAGSPSENSIRRHYYGRYVDGTCSCGDGVLQLVKWLHLMLTGVPF